MKPVQSSWTTLENAPAKPNFRSVTYTSQPRHDAAKSEPLEKNSCPKAVGIQKARHAGNCESSSDLTHGEGMRVCTPRAGAFESVAVLGVWSSGLEGGERGRGGGLEGFGFFGFTCCYGVFRVFRFSRRLPWRRRGGGKELRHGRASERDGRGEKARGGVSDTPANAIKPFQDGSRMLLSHRHPNLLTSVEHCDIDSFGQ